MANAQKKDFGDTRTQQTPVNGQPSRQAAEGERSTVDQAIGSASAPTPRPDENRGDQPATRKHDAGAR